MTSTKLTLAFSKNHVALLLASSALFTAGCSTMETTATATANSSGATMTGKVHGGNNPVANAAVYLYIVGQSGAGSAPTLLAQTTTNADGAGSFSFTKNPGNVSTLPSNPGSSYQCPTGSDALLYIEAVGGNTTGNLSVPANNTAAAFLAPVGFCNELSNAQFVDVSEVTTAATVAAAAQFINPNTDGIGNDGIGVAYQAIANAFNTIPNLVNQATGLANTTTTITGSGTGVTGVTMTVTAPAATVNTIANILSSCVNQVSATSAGNCSTLFTNAAAPGNPARESQPGLTYSQAQDTIQAALYIYLNPTNGSIAHRTALFNLMAAAGAPYQPVLTTLPEDWILPITYSTSSTCGTSSFFSNPVDLSIDVNGLLWIANKSGTNAALVQMTPYGLPQSCASLGGSLTSVVVDSGYGGATGSIWSVDTVNNLIWAVSSNGGAPRSFIAPFTPLAIAADGNGNIFFTTAQGTNNGQVWEIIAAANPNTTSSPVQITSTSVGPNPTTIFPDSVGDLWVSSGAAYVTQLATSTAVGNVHGFVATQYPVASPAYGLILGPGGSTNAANRVYVTSQDANSTLTILAPTGGSPAYSPVVTTAANTGGLITPTGIALDGGLSSWVANNGAETSGLYAVSQIGPEGASLSPNTTNGGYQFAQSYLNAGRMSVVDPVGNVWVMSDNNSNSITQLVGAAVPIYAPYALGIVNARFQTIP